MSRTYRRRGERHEYRRVLRDWSLATTFATSVLLDRRSRDGRRAIARFHSDAEFTMRSAAPRWYASAPSSPGELELAVSARR